MILWRRSKKDTVIASIEDQVAAVSKTFETRIKESNEKCTLLVAELEKLKSAHEKEMADASTRADKMKVELDEMRERHQAASALVPVRCRWKAAIPPRIWVSTHAGVPDPKE